MRIAFPVLWRASSPLGDAPCPNCGQLLWFFNAGGDTHFFEPKSGETVDTWFVRVLAEVLGVPQDEIQRELDIGEGKSLDFVNQLAMDSIDIVESVMELSAEENASNG